MSTFVTLVGLAAECARRIREHAPVSIMPPV